MRLFPDGTVRPADAPGDNTILMTGKMSIYQWTLPAFPVEDAELIVTGRLYPGGFQGAYPSPAESHVPFMLRAMHEMIPGGPYGGHGPIYGSLWRRENHPQGLPPKAVVSAPYGDCFQLEEWSARAVVPDNYEYLRDRSWSPQLRDDGAYKFYIASARFMGEIYIRYALYEISSGGQYNCLIDTGHVMSNNWGMDRYRESLAIADLGTDNPAQPYCLRIENLNAFQRPAVCLVPDMRALPWRHLL